jgi:hypothetical protein
MTYEEQFKNETQLDAEVKVGNVTCYSDKYVEWLEHKIAKMEMCDCDNGRINKSVEDPNGFCCPKCLGKGRKSKNSMML